ncbi:MAG: hypothetical protein AAF927_24285, partial [Bacteroidota bacterium]
MKNIYRYFWALALVVVLSACEKEDIGLVEPSHRVIVTSEMDFQNRIQVLGKISFGDVSAGVESRIWTFPEGVVDILDSDNDVSSTEATVVTIFNQVGQFEVKLQQSFRDEAYVGNAIQGRELDTTIVVTVLDSIQAQVEAYYLNDDGSLGDALDLSGNTINEIPASKSVRFSYTGTGEPQTLNWNFEGGTPEFVSGGQLLVDVKYKFLGSYDFSLLASRKRPFGRDTVAIDELIKVIPSTDPVLVEQIKDKQGNIAVPFGREIDPATINASDFSVMIENGGNLIMPSIASVEIDPEEGNAVIISLANESIYNDDIIKVSFIEGTLYSLDGVAASSFVDEELVFTKVNLLKTSSTYDYGFENSTIDNWTYLEWGAPWDLYNWNISSTQAYEGSNSAYVELNPNGGMIVGHVDNNSESITFPVNKDKTYELGVWVFVEDLGNNPPMGLAPDIRLYWDPDTDWGIGGNPTLAATYPTNEWVYSSA